VQSRLEGLNKKLKHYWRCVVSHILVPVDFGCQDLEMTGGSITTARGLIDSGIECVCFRGVIKELSCIYQIAGLKIYGSLSRNIPFASIRKLSNDLGI
jgi:hypothetical protein